MPLRDQISNDLKDAMRAGDTRKRDAIRLLTAALKQKEVDERKTLADPDVVAIIDKMLKQRRDSIEQFGNAGRQDLVDKETAEISVLEKYAPPAASAAELEAAVVAAIAETGATTAKDMGRVMKAVMGALAGKSVDGKAVNEMVRKKLAG